ncbi:MAG TPA: hypothetical protein VG963_31265 [Polyangiaceae bacterium]|nr:hypothetical protein [Polyangiaceae bacterium]
MARSSRHDFGGGPLRWAWLAAFAFSFLACAGDETDGAGDDSVGALTGDDGTDLGDDGLCGGQAVPGIASDIDFGGYSGDSAFRIQDWTVQEFNLVTGATSTLFSIDNHSDGSINAFVVDDNDFYAITDFELYRFDRTMQQLSLVARAPDSSFDPSLGTTKFAQHLALSATQVLTEPYSTTSSSDEQPDFYLGLFPRPAGNLDLVPIKRQDFLSYAGDQFYYVKSVANGDGTQQSELYTYDPSADASMLLASGFQHYAVVGSTLWYTAPDRADPSAFDLYSVPVQGGAPSLVNDAVATAEFVTSGTKLYLMTFDPMSGEQFLTQLDTAEGTIRTVNSCTGLLVHASDSSVYVLQFTDTGERAVRVPF